MEQINLDHAVEIKKSGHSSKGDQLKWQLNDKWYKADYMGYEALAEVVVSRLLRKSTVAAFVEYVPARIQYCEKIYQGCRSDNFLRPGEDLITVEHLLRQYTGRSAAQEMGRMQGVRDRIQYLVENVQEITGLKSFGNYITAALTIDAFFLNEDRHTNNMAVINCGNTGKYRLCPFFDFGLSLFADNMIDYPLDMDIEQCWKKISAKPFSRDFDEQLDEAEHLYGRQVVFRFDEKDVISIMNDMRRYYDEEIVSRAETVIYRQIHKYGNLF